jgi:acetoin utilization deacetylase AcuC-like enzyme
MIPLIYNPRHKNHCPQKVITNSGFSTHPDTSERIETIKDSLLKEGLGILIASSEKDLFLSEKVHSKRYLAFLNKSAYSFADNEYYFPLDFYTSDSVREESFAASFGKYCLDVCTPLSIHTFDDATYSCLTAQTGANLLKKGEHYCYALTRPAGHHAMKSAMGGFCYLNNTAVAAEILSHEGKVAILDIDFHHGNGTQDIFYNRSDVFTCSLHGSPLQNPPFYWGFEDEKGLDDGNGFNLNYVLPSLTKEKEYLKVLNNTLQKIIDYNPKYLVVSLGFDTIKNDLLGDFDLDASSFKQIGKSISELNIPMLFLQEGGYHELNGECALSFFKGVIH